MNISAAASHTIHNEANFEKMAAKVEVTKASDIKTGTGQTEGMIRQGAIVDKSDKVCASSMLHLLTA